MFRHCDEKQSSPQHIYSFSGKRTDSGLLVAFQTDWLSHLFVAPRTLENFYTAHISHNFWIIIWWVVAAQIRRNIGNFTGNFSFILLRKSQGAENNFISSKVYITMYLPIIYLFFEWKSVIPYIHRILTFQFQRHFFAYTYFYFSCCLFYFANGWSSN